MSSQVTIKDLANILGVSPSTISRSLNDHPDISQETKTLVLDLAKKLNYQPNTTAQKLRNQNTKTIGVIIPEIVHFFFSTVINGIEQIADDAGYRIMFCQSRELYDKEVLHTQSLLSHRVDGLLISVAKETTSFGHFEEARKNDVPIVFFDRMVDQMEATNVIADDHLGAKLAVLHLIDQGCVKIAHIAAPSNLSIGRDRTKGYLDALKERDLPFFKEFLVDDQGGQQEGGYQAAKALLKLSNLPDAIFANNDMAALGAIQAIKDAGLKIPNDIAIIGFSNWQLSEYIEPKLSSVIQPGLEIGKVATTKLIEEIKMKSSAFHETIRLPTSLAIRESSLKSKTNNLNPA